MEKKLGVVIIDEDIYKRLRAMLAARYGEVEDHEVFQEAFTAVVIPWVMNTPLRPSPRPAPSKDEIGLT